MASAAVATATSSTSSASITIGETRTSSGSQNTTGNKEVSESVQTLGGNEQIHNQTQPQHHVQQLQQQQQQQHENSSSFRSETPLSGDLRRILLEVAKVGTCSWLSWDQDGKDMLPSEYAASHTAAIGQHLGTKSPLGSSLVRQPFSTHRRSVSSPHAVAPSQGPPRKKHRNGLHKITRRRFGTADATAKRNTGNGGRKRPLFLIRTNPNTQNNASAFAAPGSVGSGRTSGSEPDDSTQYEWDSEGTSATTNSEVSVERLRKTHQRVNANAVQTPTKIGSLASIGDDTSLSQHYKTLQEAFRIALGLVLDHFYRHRGGYKLSPAEKLKNETLLASNNFPENSSDGRGILPLSSEDVFQQRRQKLLTMLLPDTPNHGRKGTPAAEGPPFTIQRIAEVLVSPERYYTQTHKLCNCLEKLLLVRSSTGAFGGSTGGDTSQSRREERELAALANEKGRQESELRQRRLRRRTSSPSDDVAMDSNNDGGNRSSGQATNDEGVDLDRKKKGSPERKIDGHDGHGEATSSKSASSGSSEASSREMLEAAARASLRTKFDHVGIDPHSSPDRDVLHIAENRGMTNSPPPPNLAISNAPSNVALPGHSGVAGFVRQHIPEQNPDHHTIARAPSPILFSQGSEAPMHATHTNVPMLQIHHAVALTGAPFGRTAPSPLDLMTIDAGGAAARDLEVEHGRSSASNSDVDSESDDISLDDSASDRSDGSDSGSVTHYEPFTAARAMALNRMQQQQRLQSRALTSLASLHQSEGFRPPADSEYQSGDSIDSMRAEDSGGSDSSSSDLAD